MRKFDKSGLSLGEELAVWAALAFMFWVFMMLVAEAARAEPVIGQDYLAAQQENFKFKNYNEPRTATGHLVWTFGPKLAPIRDLLGQVKPAFHRIHLLNTTCVRNHNCGSYEPVAGYTIDSLNSALEAHSPKLLAWINAQSLLYKNLAADYPETKFLVSPALEHNLTRQAYRVLANEVLSVWPEVQLVNSGEYPNGERYRGSWLENHGNLASLDSDIVSLDGIDATDIAIVPWLKRFKNIKVLYVWSRGYNCRNQGPFEDPRDRKSCPTNATFELLAHITDPRGLPPLPSFKCLQKFQAPDIWKVLAEDKGAGDSRANLPVAILSGEKTRVEVVNSLGESRGFLGYYGPYQGNQKRYYSGQIGSGKSGYQFSKGWAWLKQNQLINGKIVPTCWGPFISGRRQGAYHD